MLGIDGRVLRALWTTFLFVLAVALIYLARHTLVIFTLAIFLAHLLAPLVDRVQRSISGRVSRNVSLAIVYLALISVALAVLIPVTAKIAEQAAALAGRLPDALKEDPLSRFPLPAWLEAWRPRLTEFLTEQTTGLGDKMLPMLKQIGPGILSGLGNVVAAVLIPILSFFFLKDGRLMRNAIVGCVDTHRRSLVEEILDDLHLLVAQYIRALVLLAMATFVSYSIFLSATGVPYSVLLAGVAGMLELIPFVGPLTAAIVTLLVAGLSGYAHLLWILIFLIVYRLFQDYVLSPYLLSSGVAIHPLLVLFGVLAGEQVAGIPGMFFSVPVIAALRIIVIRMMRRQKLHA
ncbi:MAG: AI-2E family transporter [Acidobacteriia bacterium]|nr:AI-2E family transporter [Terriglobia bacterium]